MITENFLNSCFTLILNENAKLNRDKTLYRDILEVLDFIEDKETIDIPISMNSKMKCLRTICDLLMKDKTIDNIIDSISFSENFKQHIDFLEVKKTEVLKLPVIQDCLRQLRLRKKHIALFKNYDELNKVIDSIKTGAFDSLDGVIDDYESTIKTLYSNMMANNRAVSIESASSLDIVKDDFGSMFEQLIIKYDRSNKTPTGFPYLDSKILNGGYDKSRLYVWGGGSGSGKSTILNNSILYSATTNLIAKGYTDKPPVPGEIHRVFIYVTCENTIEESFMRTYMPLFDKTQTQFLTDVKNKVDIKKLVLDQFGNNSSTIIMKYFPAMSISALDLMNIVDDVIDEYGEDSIAGLYVDYLDLLKADTRYDIYRMELGHITLALKTLAVQYNIPVITATQLGRSAYKINDSSNLSVDQIGESIKKVEHADFVGLLAKDPVMDNIVHAKIGKNRAGISNVAFDFTVDFGKYKYVNAIPMANTKKADETKIGSNDFGAFTGLQL